MDQCFNIIEMSATRAECCHGGRRYLTDRKQSPYAQGLCRLAHFCMHFPAVPAQLFHVSEHQPGLTPLAGQHLQGGIQRSRVGVVGIINHRPARICMYPVQAAGYRLGAFQPVADLVQRNIKGQADRSSRQRILHIMIAG